ncbi:hypothetical protein INT48_005119 [Thamnidium elegans]|uniref:HSF-type DNA-binding domain-containing protein n=1 Tax=Thamnidium elegans TaxID=101142 RepID=A0A8H7VVQ8_9FUNG|nr:hypothetical protein INT48_005119 [Thamnidium elegans]
MNQQKHPQPTKRYTTTNKNDKPLTTRKRSHSSSSSTSSSGSPSTNLFSTAGSSDSGSSSITSVKSTPQKKKRIIPNSIDTGNSFSVDSTGNTSSPQTHSIAHTSFTSPGLITRRLTAQRSVPAFLNKLYNMVEDLSTNNLIRWSKDGSSFIVEKHEEFAKTVLPRFYKHNTFASFVRQLNMYDFHKVPHLQQGVLIAESEHEIWEFSNPHFQKGRPDLLVLVTRKRNKDRDTVDTENVSLSAVVQDLATVKKYQSTIGTDLRDLHRDNEILWQETLNAREKYQRHQEAIEKILQFLTAIFANDHLAINMNNAESLPKGLIEEAATLAGMSTKPDEATSNKLRSVLSSSPVSSSFATSSLSNILSSVLRLYSNNPSPPTPPEQKSNMMNHEFRQDSDSLPYPRSPEDLNNNNMNPPTLIDFSKTLNSATRSAQTITQDIDMLQVNIESLANNLGIDSSQFDEDMETDRCFQDNYSNMINSANSADRAKLYAIAASNADLDKKDYAIYDHKKDQRAMDTNQFNFDLQNTPPSLFQHSSQRQAPFTTRGYPSNDNNIGQDDNKPNGDFSHHQRTFDRNNNQSRSDNMNTNYYNNSAINNTAENIMSTGAAVSEYNAMVNEYGDIMRPTYFNGATNANDNYNDL